MNKVDRVIYTFWTGNNEMSSDRKNAFVGLAKNSQCPVLLITPENLHKYTNYPIHEAFQYLSETHKADYLRTHFMHYHGGGYSDIKNTTGSWLDCFTELEESDKWMCGYPELEGYAGDNWRSLIGNCSYISKKLTPLSQEWYSSMIEVLDSKLELLKKYPASHPQDTKDKSNYPLAWEEILGHIFHRVCSNHTDKLLNSLPPNIFENYR